MHGYDQEREAYQEQDSHLTVQQDEAGEGESERPRFQAETGNTAE